MKATIIFLALFLLPFSTYAGTCRYWMTLVDRTAPKVSEAESRKSSRDPLKGIQCFLKLEGRKQQGVLSGSKSFVSERVPPASVEINALYQISQLLYGNDNFAYAVALTSDPPKLVGELEVVEYNSNEVVRLAFVSYRKWFNEIQRIGLDAARVQKLDPLSGSGVMWVGPQL